MLSETRTSLVTGDGVTHGIGSGHCPLVHFNLPWLASLFSLCQTSWWGMPAPHTHFDLPTLTSHFALSTVLEMAGPSAHRSTPLVHSTVFNKQLPYRHNEPDLLFTGWPHLSSQRGQPRPDSPGELERRDMPSFRTNCLGGVLLTEAGRGRTCSLVTRGQAGPEAAATINSVAIAAVSVHLPLCDLEQ